jgi:hypothetical protein
MWDLWWTKWRWGRFFPPNTSVSPANLHSTNFSTITITMVMTGTQVVLDICEIRVSMF